MTEESSTASHLSVAMTTIGMTQITRGNAATSSSTHGIYFYFQIAVLVIGVLGTAANALVLYALHGGLQTAPVARAIGAPECSRSSHQFLHDGHLHDKALQYSPHRICWLLAVHDDSLLSDCLAWWGTIASARSTSPASRWSAI